MQASMELYERLIMEVSKESAQFETIIDQFITLDKYEVEVPLASRQLGEGIPEKWQEYLEVLKMAEKMISFTKVNFVRRLKSF